ncbi:FemAB family PEP-CTERM system-associated protein [Thalassotalea sp. 1_MG-2023]|uniref:FemAB family XrtA/PEP-CTERM system-associated protein n=1 Tax=Thalassotalea sp. 1_MG-2023 TaxID=3062680 RepID=UPI0026E1F569|nr:FemAB family XrtA/PEP-CTERM system-associated protein [Thalassotalea sp. 1_MG-2023]MDO6425483.1 FemAB family PEP-CTERM system-associated protein [Thalassotalea sp. 1_MG-2023]
MVARVITITEQDFTRWDNYVRTHKQGSFFHLSGWMSVISKSFGHSCYYIMAEDGDQVLGVLPLVEVKSALFGHALISTPFCVYGGAIADNDDVVRELESHAKTLSESLEVDYLELRYRHAQNNGLLLKQVHSTFGCELAEDSEQILAKVKKKQRAVIRHSLKNELKHQVTHDVEQFYQLLSESYRNLGTPIFSKQYFENLMNEFSQNADILVVNDAEGNPSNAVMNFYFNDQVLPYYGGGNSASRAIKSADYMYYQVMCHAKEEKGSQWYDFGRSKHDSGPYKYKKNWGMEPEPLHYYYHLVNAKELPNLSPNNPKYKLFINLWQKLPLKVSQFLGPFLSKYLG